MSVLPFSSTNHIPSSSPRAVTRGESIQEEEGTQRTVIDWLSATFPKPQFTVQFLIGLLADYCLCGLRGVDSGKGFRGFENCVRIEACINDEFKQIGFIAFGGDAQKGRWMLDLQGGGCSLIHDWEALQDLLEGLDARITRVDLAADFLEGEKTVDDAVSMYESGDFTMNGRPPQTDTQGDWLGNERGRTLYVGKRQNGKMLCVYEKGKQLGDLESNWVRYELRLGNRDRDIPLDVLTNPDIYFAGAYPALQAILDEVQGERIATISKETEIGLTQLTHHARRCYGKLISTLVKVDGYTIEGLIEAITLPGMPSRLDPAALTGGVTWDTLKTNLKGLH